MKFAVKPVLLLAALAAFLALAGCAPRTPAAPTVDADALLTQAAVTVMAQLTEIAAQTPSPLPATATLPPAEPTATQPPPPAQPEQPPAATSTSAPAGPALSSQDAASFVADVTVPDGTSAQPGAQFDKIWRIKNTGETTWTSAYTLVYLDGERMGAPDSVAMPQEVRPGETVDLAVRLTAPAKAGSYQTFFRLRNASGQFFRLDTSGDLWIKINVGGGSTATPGATQDATPEAPTATPTS